MNVAKHYAVVGVLEMWDETLEVLEDTLPFFFKGAKEMYQKKYNQVYHHPFFKMLYILLQVRRMSQNFHKGFVSEEVKDIVRKNFTREIEFYEFCKKRLLVQLKRGRKNRIN